MEKESKELISNLTKLTKEGKLSWGSERWGTYTCLTSNRFRGSVYYIHVSNNGTKVSIEVNKYLKFLFLKLDTVTQVLTTSEHFDISTLDELANLINQEVDERNRVKKMKREAELLHNLNLELEKF